jgi:hypothetical protein
MSSHKGISRTLLDEFNNIPEEESPKAAPEAKPKKGKKGQEESESQNESFHREYETRNRQRGPTTSEGRTRGGNSKSALKPRQENSLGELTKKFIQLIKQTEDY